MIDERSVTGKAVVIGAGTMGTGIAAQLANAGWRVKLLDVAGPDPYDAETRSEALAFAGDDLNHSETRSEATALAGDDLNHPEKRSAAAVRGLERLRTARPPLLFLPEYAERIQPGNTSDNLSWLGDADWIVEAVAERMDVKQSVLAQIDEHGSPRAVISSNTSGLSLRAMAEGRSAGFRSRFLGSHFLNPPRYLKLLEVVTLPETDTGVQLGFMSFAEQVLGHRVVIARDTPGFISTRIWIEHLVATMQLAVQHGVSVEEADYLTGPFLGRPRSATFRMADLVGLDIVSAIAHNQQAALPDDPFRACLDLPAIVQRLVADGHYGDKTGAGFFKRDGKAALAVDLASGEYRPREEVRIPEVEALLAQPLADRLKHLADARDTEWGSFVNAVLDSLTAYVEYVGPLVAADTISVDNVMRWGFQWALGPYRMEDLRSGLARSFRRTIVEERMRVFGRPDMRPVLYRPEYVSLEERETAGQKVFETEDGALFDLGDGVACLAFRTKMNTFTPALCSTIDRAREIAESSFAAIVIGSDSPHFSAGYNLKLLLDSALAEEWSLIDTMLKEVQETFLRLKYGTIPTVAAVRGFTLGAGCECALHCSAIQAASELSMGLPELSAGLVPGGGGVKELLARAMAGWNGRTDALPRVELAFNQLVLNGSSTSADEARKFGLLRPTDAVTRNADRLLYEAKQKALSLAAAYRPPQRERIPVFGLKSLAYLRARIAAHVQAGRFTAYDAVIAEKIAFILSGGDAESQREVLDETLLAMERSALIALAQEPKSIERMRALLQTGRPLRN